VWAISPDTGSTDGSTPVLIHGEGFEPGARVTLDRAARDVTVLSSTTISALTAIHPPGVVDVFVTNPGGESGRLPQGYTYAFVSDGRSPVIAAVSPDAGTVGGGTEISVIGSGFQPGVTVRMDDNALRTFPFDSSSTTIRAQAPAHPPGTVDVVVLNPDGQSARLAAAYRYAVPGALDVNGEWEGGADDLRDSHSGTEIRMTIKNFRLVDITCIGGAEMTMVAPAAIHNDGFAFIAGGRPLVTGRFLSADSAVGSIDFPPCGPSWVARKK
jgi:hypothetical protein